MRGYSYREGPLRGFRVLSVAGEKPNIVPKNSRWPKVEAASTPFDREPIRIAGLLLRRVLYRLPNIF